MLRKPLTRIIQLRFRSSGVPAPKVFPKEISAITENRVNNEELCKQIKNVLSETLVGGQSDIEPLTHYYFDGEVSFLKIDLLYVKLCIICKNIF